MSSDTTFRLRTLIVDDEPVARAHLRALLESRDDIEVIGECGDGRSAVERIRMESPDLVLLDVQMPELSGLDVVREIGPDRMPPVVFVTAYDQHALAAFEVHATDYILKPVHRGRFTRAIDRVVRLARAEPAVGRPALAQLVDELSAVRAPVDRLAIKVGDRVLYLKLADIDWIEAADDLVRIHAARHVYDHRSTLAQLEQRLPSSRFLRIHRSTIVNVERIREFQPWFQGDWILVLADGTRLQSGKSYRQKIRELIEG
jgi:two-component system, LytTR family, response regulator